MFPSKTRNISSVSASESVANKSTIFGPVSSRRFGVSLGIDLSPETKSCNFDCVYCELPKAQRTDTISHPPKVDRIIEDVTAALKNHPLTEVITITANGEPTLYPDLESLIDALIAIKGERRLMILTNSSTLPDPKVRAALKKLDSVKCSLDCVTKRCYKRIDRPLHTDVSDVIEALRLFRDEYDGELLLEILLVAGINDTIREFEAFANILPEIRPDRIDIGTIDRPPAYPVQGVSYKELHAISMMFDPSLPLHIASRQHAESCVGAYSEEEIVNTLDKRPLTAEDVTLLFDEASKERLRKLIEAGEIVETTGSGIAFYVPAKNVARKRQKA